MTMNLLTAQITDTHASAIMPLGTILKRTNPSYPNRGEEEWVYVYNDEASTDFAQGNCIMRDAATPTCDGILSTGAVASTRVLGVAQHAIPAGYYGFILKRGLGKVLCDGNVTANSPITPDSSGEVTDLVANSEYCVIGTALATDAGETLVAAWINCLGS